MVIKEGVFYFPSYLSRDRLSWFINMYDILKSIHGIVNILSCFVIMKIFSSQVICYSNEWLCVGVYADNDDIKESLSEKYGKFTVSELQEKEFDKDVMEGDICMTVRLQIVYGKLSIRSVRSAFEESVGNRLQKFGGSDNKELLHKWVILWLKVIVLETICVVFASSHHHHHHHRVNKTWSLDPTLVSL